MSTFGCVPQTLDDWVKKAKRDVLRHAGSTSHGGVTQTKQPPQNPGRFTPVHMMGISKWARCLEKISKQHEASGLMSSFRSGERYPSGEGRLYAEDLIVKIEGPAGTMIVSA
jgi:hypothetical protein